MHIYGSSTIVYVASTTAYMYRVRVCADTPGAQSAVAAAFPVLSDGTPMSCAAATACAAPFLLDPVVALRDAGPVPGWQALGTGCAGRSPHSDIAI